jgi:predicted Zn-dependent protease with MMP-like domain
MTFDQFNALAHQIFAEVPDEYKRGVDGLEVTRRTVLHPTLPEVYTMGECLSEFYPSEFGGPGEVRSRVVLYYGSFLAVARGEEDWNWDDEIWETITHEIKHHLEHLASEDALEETDYAEDQNFARREGEPFDPFFYQKGERVENDVYAIDGDLFVVVQRGVVGRREDGPIELEFLGKSLRIRPPVEAADVAYLRVPDPPVDMGPGELFVVLVRKRSLMGWLRGLLNSSRMVVHQSEALVEAAEAR